MIVGKKSGYVEKWDTRVGNTPAALVKSVCVPGGENIMDFEQSVAHNVLMVANGKKVWNFQLSCVTFYCNSFFLSYSSLCTLLLCVF